MARPGGPEVDGILLLDKPLGLGSTQALGRARRLLGARKAGHGGTLDPMATGLLPLAFGSATRFAHESLDAAKTYAATLLLGVTTDGGDVEGAVLLQRAVAVDEARWHEAAGHFVGKIEQVPPMHSALKHEGRPLYDYARRGEVIDRVARRVSIDSLDLLALRPVDGVAAGAPGSLTATIRVRCSKGTYIRALAADIGERLGCGAHLIALRREAVGALHVDQAVRLDDLEAMPPHARLGRLLPGDALMAPLRPLVLESALARRFLQGQRLRLDAPGAAASDARDAVHADRVRVYDGSRLIGTGLYADGLLRPLRLLPQAA
jgi:tRNA pseudouridine55 synthase